MCPEDPEGTNKIELLSFTHIRLWMLIGGSYGWGTECRSHSTLKKLQHRDHPGNADSTAILVTRLKNVRHWKTRLNISFKMAICANSSKVRTRVLIDPFREKNILEGMNEGNLILDVITTMTNVVQSNNEGLKPLKGSSLHKEAIVWWLTQSLDDLHLKGVQALLGKNVYGLFNRCTDHNQRPTKNTPNTLHWWWLHIYWPNLWSWCELILDWHILEVLLLFMIF